MVALLLSFHSTARGAAGDGFRRKTSLSTPYPRDDLRSDRSCLDGRGNLAQTVGSRAGSLNGPFTLVGCGEPPGVKMLVLRPAKGTLGIINSSLHKHPMFSVSHSHSHSWFYSHARWCFHTHSFHAHTHTNPHTHTVTVPMPHAHPCIMIPTVVFREGRIID